MTWNEFLKSDPRWPHGFGIDPILGDLGAPVSAFSVINSRSRIAAVVSRDRVCISGVVVFGGLVVNGSVPEVGVAALLAMEHLGWRLDALAESGFPTAQPRPLTEQEGRRMALLRLEVR